MHVTASLVRQILTYKEKKGGAIISPFNEDATKVIIMPMILP